MQFSSPRFIVFLAFVLVCLALISTKTTKKRFLATASCVFYAAWDWRYLGLLLLVSVIDYVAGLRIGSCQNPRERKTWLILSIVSNLGILAYFKYANFFINSANQLLDSFGVRLPGLEVILPAGISFYTFKTMSYTIDVYRREIEPCRSWIDYATFVTFFPELIAGPIVRASVFLPQMSREIGASWRRIADGGSLFLLGLVKKLLIADRMAGISDTIFDAPDAYSSGLVWCGVIAYAIQIYCDFSGYSDMAVGIARIIGYDLPENFRMPYLAENISEFWRRWHITLSQWLRDYLYIPLGGNRKGRLITYRNLFLTMLLGGLWHGASWNFVLWGALHGGALAIHKAFSETFKGRRIFPRWISQSMTLLFVILAWVPFRSTSWESTLSIFAKLAYIGPDGGVFWIPTWLYISMTLLVLGHLIGNRIERIEKGGIVPQWFKNAAVKLGLRLVVNPLSGAYLAVDRPTVTGAYMIMIVLLGLGLFAPLNTNPFIYFQF